MKSIISLGIILILTCGCTLYASVIYVPEDYPTIQDAVNATEGGDTVLVHPGTYFERINITLHSNIMLASTHGPHQTVIDGMGEGTTLSIYEGTVDGFTIRNGLGIPKAGGVSVTGTATIMNCIITENEGRDWGGGLACDIFANALIVNNIIVNNHCYVKYSEQGHPEEDSYGAGIMIADSGLHGVNAQVINNTIVGNVSHGDPENQYYTGRSGAVCVKGGTVLFANNIIALNESERCPIEGNWLPDVTFEHNNIWNNIGDSEGCYEPDPYMSEDPLFAVGPYGDYYLGHIAAGQENNSPCINQGNNSAEFWGLDFFTTRTDEEYDEGIVDIGYHYQAPAGVIMTKISANQSVYESGDDFMVILNIINPGEEQNARIFVVLDVAQNYWFWPSWSETIDFDQRALPGYGSLNVTILDGIWPEENITGSAIIWAGLLDPETSGLLGNYDYCSFEF